MADLLSLRKSILTLPASEVMEIHRQIRESRKTIKKPRTKAGAKRKSVKKTLLSALDGMSGGELDELIKELEGRL